MNWIMGIFIPLNILIAVLSHNWQAACLAVSAGACYVGWLGEKDRAAEFYWSAYDDGFDQGYEAGHYVGYNAFCFGE